MTRSTADKIREHVKDMEEARAHGAVAPTFWQSYPEEAIPPERRREDWADTEPNDFDSPSVRPADRYDLLAWVLIFCGCLIAGLTVLAVAAWWSL